LLLVGCISEAFLHARSSSLLLVRLRSSGLRRPPSSDPSSQLPVARDTRRKTTVLKLPHPPLANWTARNSFEQFGTRFSGSPIHVIYSWRGTPGAESAEVGRKMPRESKLFRHFGRWPSSSFSCTACLPMASPPTGLYSGLFVRRHKTQVRV